MLLSMARGKVADLVFSRLDGEQVVRSRNRHPKNPRTDAQLYQRAIMATVLRAYAAGKMIFDHSFEGVQVGAKNQRKFLSINNKKLRGTVAADIEAGNIGAACAARIVAPGITSPVAYTFQVSEGSLAQELFTSVGKLNGIGAVENESVSQYLARMGVTADDLFTVVGFRNASDAIADNVLFTVNGATTAYGRQTRGTFFFVRLKPNPEAFTSTDAIAETTPLSDLFVVDYTHNFTVDLASLKAADAIVSATTFGTDAFLCTSGVIRSRENEGLRSTCILQWPIGDAAAYGLTSDVLLAAWSQSGTAIGDSELILEGGQDF